jgi:hypothetical protein
MEDVFLLLEDKQNIVQNLNNKFQINYWTEMIEFYWRGDLTRDAKAVKLTLPSDTMQVSCW